MKLKSLKIGDYFRFRFSIDEPIVKGEDGTIYSGCTFELGPKCEKFRLCRVVNGPRSCFSVEPEMEVIKVFKHTRFNEGVELL